MRRFSLIFLFAVGILIVSSGQQRYSPQRPTRTTARPAATTIPVAPPTPQSIAEPSRGKLTEPVPLVALRPEDMVWSEPGRGDRSTAPQSIALLGDPRSEGLYVIRTKIPKGKQIVPHVHGDSRSVVVISGTYYYGIGETFDAAELRAFPPGSFLTEPAGMPHFTWAKDDDVVIQTTAVGPSSTRVLPDEPTGKPKAIP